MQVTMGENRTEPLRRTLPNRDGAVSRNWRDRFVS